MNILYFNLSVDSNDLPLAFGVDWINNFSETVEHVDVITFRAGDFNLPENVRVHSVAVASKFKIVSMFLTVYGFYKVLFRLLRTRKYDLCFSHMNILFVNLGSIICRLYNIPIKLWYAHPSRSLKLRLAVIIVDQIITSFPGAFPYRSPKVREIGTGITLDLFESLYLSNPTYDIIYCGRISSSKNIEDLITAVYDIKSRFNRELSVLIVGPTENTDADKNYTIQLKKYIESILLEKQFTFFGSASREELADHYRSAKVHVNLTYSGFGDKVVLESIYCLTPTVLRNVGMQSLLLEYRDIFMYDRKEDLSDTLIKVLDLDENEKYRMMSKMRDHIRACHDISTIARRILDA